MTTPQDERSFSHLYSELFEGNPSDRDRILENLSKNAASYKRRAEEIQSKLRGKHILLDNPETLRLKKRRVTKCSTNVLRCAERKQCHKALYSSLTYDKLRPLYLLWESYMKDLVSITQRANLENALLRADYHGAYLRIVQTKCPSLIGKCGIVVQETLNTFVMMQCDSKPLVVPKAGCVFECALAGVGTPLRWQLFGDQLRQHSGLRSSKKFKSRNTVSMM